MLAHAISRVRLNFSAFHLMSRGRNKPSKYCNLSFFQRSSGPFQSSSSKSAKVGKEVKGSNPSVKKSSSGDNIITAEFMKVREEKFGRLESATTTNSHETGQEGNKGKKFSNSQQ